MNHRLGRLWHGLIGLSDEPPDDDDLRLRKRVRVVAETRSDELLTNAMPMSIAARLKHGERRIAESYPETTVLVADPAGFTPWAQQTDPPRVCSLSRRRSSPV